MAESEWHTHLDLGRSGGAASERVPTKRVEGEVSYVDQMATRAGHSPAAIPIDIRSRRSASEHLPSSEDIGSDLSADAGRRESGAGLSKRVNLQELLSSSMDDRSATQKALKSPPRSSYQPGIVVKDRIQGASTAHQKQGSEGIEHSIKYPATIDQSSNKPQSSSSSSSLGNSFSQSVKTLSERYSSSREASETFNKMRSRESQESYPSSASSSSPVKPSHHRSGSNFSQELDVRTTGTPKIGEGERTSPKVQPATIPQSVESGNPVTIPAELVKGDVMLKVTSKKVMQRTVRINPDAGQILWDSKKNNRVNLESIREVRVGAEAKSYRLALSIAPAHEKRWLSIIYQTNSIYKTLHLIALSDESLARWQSTLMAVQQERKLLTSCVDLLEQRQSLFLRQHFQDADSSSDDKLDFDEVIRLCRRLGIFSNRTALREKFNEADVGSNGYLDFASFQRFVGLLKRRRDVESIYDRLSNGSEDGISLESFVEFLRMEQGNAVNGGTLAIQQVFEKHAGAGTSTMGLSGLLAFLMSSDNSILRDQSSIASQEEVGGMERENSESTQIRQNAQTAEQLIAISGQTRVTQDMSRPLSEYYISSSHNTYLVGGQLTGTSTVEGYIRALMLGARSVELDCWDGPGNEPVVTHGHTLTSKVLFRDVIEAISRYAFVASPYPLVLSLEVHNEVGQQKVLASILHTVLGDKLLTEPLQDLAPGNLQCLPSPHALMGKILIKTKNVLLSKTHSEKERFELVSKEKTGTASATTDTTESESDSLISNARELVRSVAKNRSLRRRRSFTSPSRNAAGTEKDEVMASALAAFLIYTVGVKHRGINKKEIYAVEHMISLSERTAEKYAKSATGGPNSEDLIKHNRTHLTRIYPSMHKLIRLSQSANFLPNSFWRLGCQLVALNWQTLDLGYEMNQAMFARNGRTGYVLKPEALRRKEENRTVGHAARPGAAAKSTTITVSVKVISAQQLPRLRPNDEQKSGIGEELTRDDVGAVMHPFVSLALLVPETGGYNVECVRTPFSELATSARKKASIARMRTSTIHQNGFNPIWDEELKFRVTVPISVSGNERSNPTSANNVSRSVKGLLDLCFLRFEVRNDTKRQSVAALSYEASDPTSKGSAKSQFSERGSTKTLHSTSSSTTASSTSTSAHHNDRNATAAMEYSADDDASPCTATYMISLGAMQQGYRHVPLYDATLTQHIFSTLFVRTCLSL